nr:CD1375 family protein [uncultured Cellulosilyticum sp.]
MINKTRLRAYARTIQNGTRTIEEVPEEYGVPVYVELMASFNWTIDMVDENYVEAVKRELGIIEA